MTGLALFLLQGEGGGGLGFFLFTMPAIFLVFYLIVIRPQQKQQQRHQQMLSQLKSGDRVVTRGGIRGTVVGLKEKEEAIILRIPPDQVKLEILRSAVEAVERPEEEPKQSK